MPIHRKTLSAAHCTLSYHQINMSNHSHNLSLIQFDKIRSMSNFCVSGHSYSQIVPRVDGKFAMIVSNFSYFLKRKVDTIKKQLNVDIRDY